VNNKRIKCFVRVFIFIVFQVISINVFAQSQNQSSYQKVNDVFVPASSSSVEIKGYLGEKINLCIANRVMTQSIENLIKPFRLRFEKDFSGFRCEYWGKWFTSAMLAYSYQPTAEHRKVIDKALDKLLETQSPNGYIGTYDKKHYLGGWDIWGQKYTLLGLIAYYDYTKDARVLEDACRVADLLLTKVGPGKVNIAENGIPVLQGLASTSILRAIVLLYERTGNKKYLNFAKYIVHQWSVPNKFTPTGLRLIQEALAGVPPIEIGAPKAFEMMSNFEGVLELYKATGEKKYLEAALKFGNSIRKYERMITGSCSNQELWCDGVREQTEVLSQPVETCVTVTWMRYCYQLLRATGNPVWADELEQSLYNALLGAMSPDGGWWAYFSPLIGERIPSPMQHEDVGLSCCVANGPRALLLTPRWAVMGSKEGVVVNLYSQGSYGEKLSDGTEVKILQSTDYPVGDEVNITVEPSKTKRFTISLRIPEWSKKNELSINGEQIKCTPGSYVKINRVWTEGDKIVLKLDLRGRLIPAPSGAPDLAVMRGPILLALDSRLTEPQDSLVWLAVGQKGSKGVEQKMKEGQKEENLEPIAQMNPSGYTRIEPVITANDAPVYIDLKPAKNKPEGVWMAFEVPFLVRPSHFFNHQKKTLVMCDYSSAGNEWNEKNLYRVWIPQPMYMGNMYPKNFWRIIYPKANMRPVFPQDKP